MPKKRSKKNKKIFGFPIPVDSDKCCVLLIATVILFLAATTFFPLNNLPLETPTDPTSTTTDTGTTTTTTTTTGTGDIRFLVQMEIQWNDVATSKADLRFNVYETVGTYVLDYHSFTEAEGDDPFTWHYGSLGYAFPNGIMLRLVMVGDDNFSFESFTTVVYLSAGYTSHSFPIYFNGLAGQTEVGDLYVTWEEI